MKEIVDFAFSRHENSSSHWALLKLFRSTSQFVLKKKFICLSWKSLQALLLSSIVVKFVCVKSRKMGVKGRLNTHPISIWHTSLFSKRRTVVCEVDLTALKDLRKVGRWKKKTKPTCLDENTLCLNRAKWKKKSVRAQIICVTMPLSGFNPKRATGTKEMTCKQQAGYSYSVRIAQF